MCRNVLKTCAVALSLWLLTSSYLIASFSSALPQFFVGMYAKYEFEGNITLNGQTVYELASVNNWTVLDLERDTAEMDVELVITHVKGFIPDPVAEVYNPFPNTSWRKSLEFDLNSSYWWYYLSDEADDLLKYRSGERTVESEVGVIQCHYLQLRRPQQEWDAFYDKGSGILISFQETFWVNDYIVSYSKRITDTQMHN